MISFKEIIFWFLFVLSIVVVVWLIFGESPTLEQALLVMILTLLWSSNNRLTKLEMKFNALATDFKEHLKHKK